MIISYPIKLQCWLSNCDHMNKSVILSCQTDKAHNSRKWHYFQLNISKNITHDFGKYSIMLNSFVIFYSDLEDQPFFKTLLLILVCIDKHPPSYSTDPIIKMCLTLQFLENTWPWLPYCKQIADTFGASGIFIFIYLLPFWDYTKFGIRINQ